MMNINEYTIKSPRKKLFLYWLEFLRPYHNLRNREIEALALFLYYEHQLSKHIEDKESLAKMLQSKKIKSKIKEEMKMSTRVFSNLLWSMRQNKALGPNNEINPALRPKLHEKGFSIVINLIDDGSN